MLNFMDAMIANIRGIVVYGQILWSLLWVKTLVLFLTVIAVLLAVICGIHYLTVVRDKAVYSVKKKSNIVKLRKGLTIARYWSWSIAYQVTRDVFSAGVAVLLLIVGFSLLLHA